MSSTSLLKQMQLQAHRCGYKGQAVLDDFYAPGDSKIIVSVWTIRVCFGKIKNTSSPNNCCFLFRTAVIVTITLGEVMITLFFLTHIQYKIAWRKIVFPLCGNVIASTLSY
jgi:hypothetical protein